MEQYLKSFFFFKWEHVLNKLVFFLAKSAADAVGVTENNILWTNLLISIYKALNQISCSYYLDGCFFNLNKTQEIEISSMLHI